MKKGPSTRGLFIAEATSGPGRLREPLLDRATHCRGDRESSTVPRRERFGIREELRHAFGRDVLQRPAGPRRKADAEDRADVRVVNALQHAFGEAAGGL